MSKLTLVLVAGFLFLTSCSTPRMHALSDNELDNTTAAGDLCGYFGIDGPCMASILQLYNPQSPTQSQEAALPLSAAGGTSSLALQATSSSPDGTRTQTATQTNSTSSQPGIPTRGIDLSPTSIYTRTTPSPRP